MVVVKEELRLLCLYRCIDILTHKRLSRYVDHSHGGIIRHQLITYGVHNVRLADTGCAMDKKGVEGIISRLLDDRPSSRVGEPIAETLIEVVKLHPDVQVRLEGCTLSIRSSLRQIGRWLDVLDRSDVCPSQALPRHTLQCPSKGLVRDLIIELHIVTKGDPEGLLEYLEVLRLDP